MAQEQTRDDSSHYEVSLTAGQAFIAFVLLLFSLAAAFAFGVIIGKGQDAGSLIARDEPAAVAEGKPVEDAPRIRELGISEGPEPRIIEEEPAQPAEDPAPSAPRAAERESAELPPMTSTQGKPAADAASTEQKSGPWFAQILSTSDAKSAEALAARLIDSGYTSAYVQRNHADSGTVFRVRVRFPDETAARAAATPLEAFSKGEVWVTSQ